MCSNRAVLYSILVISFNHKGEIEMLNNYMNPYNPYPAMNSTNNNPPNNNVNWVRVAGAESTKNQVVQPNQTLWMMDNNEPIFYVKSADSLGVSTTKAYRFEEINLNIQDKIEYLNKNDVEKIVREILKEKEGVKNVKSFGKSNE